jgi:hypothetical protein
MRIGQEALKRHPRSEYAREATPAPAMGLYSYAAAGNESGLRCVGVKVNADFARRLDQGSGTLICRDPPVDRAR